MTANAVNARALDEFGWSTVEIRPVLTPLQLTGTLIIKTKMSTNCCNARAESAVKELVSSSILVQKKEKYWIFDYNFSKIWSLFKGEQQCFPGSAEVTSPHIAESWGRESQLEPLRSFAGSIRLYTFFFFFFLSPRIFLNNRTCAVSALSLA